MMAQQQKNPMASASTKYGITWFFCHPGSLYIVMLVAACFSSPSDALFDQGKTPVCPVRQCMEDQSVGEISLMH
jgi:hypothetical protein